MFQEPDGTLSSRFVPEMIPAFFGQPLSLKSRAAVGNVEAGADSARLQSIQGMAAIEMADLPRNVRLTLQGFGGAGGRGKPPPLRNSVSAYARASITTRAWSFGSSPPGGRRSFVSPGGALSLLTLFTPFSPSMN